MTQVTAVQERLFEELPGKLFNGVFTLIGPKGHRTLKIKTVLDGPLKGKRIIYVMTGPDNVFSYTGVGFVQNDDEVRIWQRQQGTELHKTVSAFLQVYLQRDPAKWSAYRVEEARYCLNCNRILTNPESIERGLGPVCGAAE